MPVYSIYSPICKTISKYSHERLYSYAKGHAVIRGAVGMCVCQEMLDLFYVWEGVFHLNDACPLGSGAGFGVSLDIDREMTARELGFSRVQTNPIYCQNSRGKTEGQILSFLTSVGLAVNKVATDLVLFSTAEFAFFELSDQITTGSSIMPQKRNLDVMELARGRTSLLIGYENTLKSLTANLISGYHRDLQETKKIMISAFNLVRDLLKVTQTVFAHIKPNEKKLVLALDKTVFATDYAYEKVKQGMSFRDAYREVGSHLDQLPEFDVYENLKAKKHLGATGNLGLERFESRLEKEISDTALWSNQIKEIEKNLLGGIA